MPSNDASLQQMDDNFEADWRNMIRNWPRDLPRDLIPFLKPAFEAGYKMGIVRGAALARKEVPQ